MIKSWRMRWAGHAARMREKRNAYMTGAQTGGPRGNFLWPTMLCNKMKTNKNKCLNKSNYIAIYKLLP
jgi:hypothetical protein